jgi:hypothetical protein
VTAGAVNKPDELTVPAVADHVTASFGVLLTTADNCRMVPEVIVTFEGDTDTTTAPLPPVDEVAPPPQPALRITAASIVHNKHTFKNVFRCRVHLLGGAAACQSRALARRTFRRKGGGRLSVVIPMQSAPTLEWMR